MTVPTIYTIGHSTRTIGDFIALLAEHDVETLVDIRSVPQSRWNPQFSQTVFSAALANAGIGYWHLKTLGGLRYGKQESAPVYSHYKDYMQTTTFAAALSELIAQAKESRLAIMCAEAKPQLCHRFHVSDALLQHGVSVVHLLSAGLSEPHKLPAPSAQKSFSF